MLIQLLVLILLIAFNAFFAASEIALISLNDNKIKVLADRGDNKAQMIVNLLDDPGRFLATIQIGITLSGFLASAFAAENFAGRLVSLVEKSGLDVSIAIIKPLAVIFITIILAYFTLVLGELVPKRIAMQKSEQIARFSIRGLTIISILSAPFIKLLTVSTNFFIYILGGNPNADEESITEEEIRIMVDVGEQKGAIQETEKKLINNIFDFDDKNISEIMTHRTDVIGLKLELGFFEIVDIINKQKFTRFPVYHGSLDNIVGILHVKDLLRFLNKNNVEGFDLSQIIRKPYFVPENKKADDLLQELQKSRLHIAVVVDEYGGTAGIITIEDLLEEIVGDIEDEYDNEDNEYEKIDDNTYIFQGMISLDMVEEILEVKLPSDEYDTLSGYIIGQLDRIPIPGENPTVELDNIILKVEEIESKRITKIKSCRI
ncbi:MAG TPA: hemolysin family protein [Syntrophomonadaceae bacterium]|nr:hemolysin family protein [Syntrophomonadaceae bacterium]